MNPRAAWPPPGPDVKRAARLAPEAARKIAADQPNISRTRERRTNQRAAPRSARANLRMKTKAELFGLVADLHGEGLSRSQISEALGYTPQRISQVMAELKLQQKRFRSTLAAVEALPRELRERVIAFRMRPDCKKETDVGTATTARHLRAAEEESR